MVSTGKKEEGMGGNGKKKSKDWEGGEIGLSGKASWGRRKKKLFWASLDGCIWSWLIVKGFSKDGVVYFNLASEPVSGAVRANRPGFCLFFLDFDSLLIAEDFILEL